MDIGGAHEARAEPVRLSAARRRVLDFVTGAGSPVTVLDVVAGLGGHANTQREHLEALTRDGLLHRGHVSASSPGRPASTYTSAPSV